MIEQKKHSVKDQLQISSALKMILPVVAMSIIPLSAAHAGPNDPTADFLEMQTAPGETTRRECLANGFFEVLFITDAGTASEVIVSRVESSTVCDPNTATPTPSPAPSNGDLIQNYGAIADQAASIFTSQLGGAFVAEPTADPLFSLLESSSSRQSSSNPATNRDCDTPEIRSIRRFIREKEAELDAIIAGMRRTSPTGAIDTGDRDFINVTNDLANLQNDLDFLLERCSTDPNAPPVPQNRTSSDIDNKAVAFSEEPQNEGLQESAEITSAPSLAEQVAEVPCDFDGLTNIDFKLLTGKFVDLLLEKCPDLLLAIANSSDGPAVPAFPAAQEDGPVGDNPAPQAGISALSQSPQIQALTNELAQIEERNEPCARSAREVRLRTFIEHLEQRLADFEADFQPAVDQVRRVRGLIDQAEDQLVEEITERARCNGEDESQLGGSARVRPILPQGDAPALYSSGHTARFRRASFTNITPVQTQSRFATSRAIRTSITPLANASGASLDVIESDESSRWMLYLRTRFDGRDDDRVGADIQSDLFTFTIGGGARVGPRTALGGELFYRTGDVQSDALFSKVEGDYYGGNLRIAHRFSDSVNFAVGASYIHGKNDLLINEDAQNVGGFDVDAFNAHATLQAKVPLGPVTLLPTVNGTFSRINRNSFITFGVLDIPQNKFSSGRINGGLNVIHNLGFSLGKGKLKPNFGLFLDFQDRDTSGSLLSTGQNFRDLGFGGNASLGLAWELDNGSRFSLNGNFGYYGEDVRNYSATIRYTVPLP
ncbi:MAG: autotransporter outer membrane beta-barrel domain-containing protein [Erythrobacter sp.]|uniref:autotransporter outer membrane beta-barrel domain-containing protein n=1 Tax=Erythrobacter sp. TaxID=1042 RepID=UPI003299309B